MVLPPFCLDAVGLAFIAPELPLAALLAALRAFTSLSSVKKRSANNVGSITPLSTILPCFVREVTFHTEVF